MIPAAFEYTRARTLAEALKAIGSKGTKALAGGQTLIPLLRFRLTQTRRVIDIAGLPQLKGIARSPKGLRIGAGTTYRELLDSALVRREAPLIAEVTEDIGDRQVRNVATIGGALAHADPASDMPAVLLALDASFTLQSSRGKREVPARKFFLSAFTTALKRNELLTQITVPALKGAGSAYASFEQPASHYALVGAAARVTKQKGSVSSATLAFTGLSDHAFLCDAAQPLVGTPGDARTIGKVAEAAIQGVEPNDDIHAPAEYRLHLAQVMARRALEQALSRAT
jgi:carbon-monoxide dehydrogenase medium subunit